jgi:hypothetical protein
MDKSRAEELLRELDDGWRLNPDVHLERTYDRYGSGALSSGSEPAGNSVQEARTLPA